MTATIDWHAVISEFELIRKYFSSHPRPGLRLGIGDDAAIVELPITEELVTVSCVLTGATPHVNGESPRELGHRVLSIAMNRMAARGIVGAWFSLSLTLANSNEYWLESFTRGLDELATRYGLSLIGGDTTRGDLTVALILMGSASPRQTIGPAGAHPGDTIYMSGTLGVQASVPLMASGTGNATPGLERAMIDELQNPSPRVNLGCSLKGTASACVSLDRGLGTALEELLRDQGLGAAIDISKIPLAPPVRSHFESTNWWRPVLSLSGDHELLFTSRNPIGQIDSEQVPLSAIGQVLDAPNLAFEWPDS